MKFSELLKLHTLRRLPAIVAAVLITAVFGLYYVGAYDISFIERPEAWKNNLNRLKEIFVEEKEPENTLPAETEPEETPETQPAETEPAEKKPKKKGTGTKHQVEKITIKTVSELQKEGYSLTPKVWDSSCVMGKLVCDYAWPKKFSYSKKTADVEKFTTYDDGTETKREVIREEQDRLALETYMGYILYDDRGTVYILSPDGQVMRQFDETEYMPAYTRDLQGRPLFYRTYTTTLKYPTEIEKKDDKEKKTADKKDEKEEEPKWLKTADLQVDCKSYYYLSDNGQYFIESDYNDSTDNRGLYFDYPVYYGNTDNQNLKRYVLNSSAVVTNLEKKTEFMPRMKWMYYNSDYLKPEELEFDKDGKNKKDPKGKSLEELFPYTMAYNYRENYATVKMDIKWTYNHDEDDGKGGKVNKDVKVTSNELRVVDTSGKVMFSSRKNYFSELGWTANERFVEPLSTGIDSIGSYYFDHGLMRLRVQSYDRFYFTDLHMMFIVTDDDILIKPDGTKFNIPTNNKLLAYSDGILLLKNGDTYSYMNSDGIWLKDAMEFTDAKTFLEGVAVCALNGKYGVINTDGKVLIPFEYDYISTISSGTMTAYKDGSGWSVFQKLSK